MTYVITRLCRDCKDMGCMSVCPKDCILEHRPPSGASDLPNQLFIDPEECVDCGACVPECPWEAIYPDTHVPPELEPDVALNALVLERREEFRLPEGTRPAAPDAEAVRRNKQRWGLERAQASLLSGGASDPAPAGAGANPAREHRSCQDEAGVRSE